MATVWKKGRGKLGVLQPLLGRWETVADSELGPLTCTRSFERVLSGAYVELRAIWRYAPSDGGTTGALGKPRPPYEEFALIGPGDDGVLTFWSFTSDGKRSIGRLADATDIHPEAIGFEAQMPAGLARMAYWPADGEGYMWAVEAKNAKDWKRFLLHHYHPIE